jgi:hypothetical protein
MHSLRHFLNFLHFSLFSFATRYWFNPVVFTSFSGARSVNWSPAPSSGSSTSALVLSSFSDQDLLSEFERRGYARPSLIRLAASSLSAVAASSSISTASTATTPSKPKVSKTPRLSSSDCPDDILLAFSSVYSSLSPTAWTATTSNVLPTGEFTLHLGNGSVHRRLGKDWKLFHSPDNSDFSAFLSFHSVPANCTDSVFLRIKDS